MKLPNANGKKLHSDERTYRDLMAINSDEGKPIETLLRKA